MISGRTVSIHRYCQVTHLILFLAAAFRTVLHQAVRDGLREEVDDIQINGARQIGSGWMHIHGVFEFLVIGCIVDMEFIQTTEIFQPWEELAIPTTSLLLSLFKMERCELRYITSSALFKFRPLDPSGDIPG
jgi:hypothetical protein